MAQRSRRTESDELNRPFCWRKKKTKTVYNQCKTIILWERCEKIFHIRKVWFSKVVYLPNNIFSEAYWCLKVDFYLCIKELEATWTKYVAVVATLQTGATDCVSILKNITTCWSWCNTARTFSPVVVGLVESKENTKCLNKDSIIPLSFLIKGKIRWKNHMLNCNSETEF